MAAFDDVFVQGDDCVSLAAQHLQVRCDDDRVVCCAQGVHELCNRVVAILLRFDQLLYVSVRNTLAV